MVRRVAGQARRRLGWGVADQAVSSLTNFAVSIYIARTLGAVEFGAFSIAYVTYSFALNASRGLATDPLLVRFSGSDLPTWRRAVASSTGTAAAVGLAIGACMLVAAVILHGATRLALLALAITLPALLVQDSWRLAFFALGRGDRAFVNDVVWAGALLPALVVLRVLGNEDVFWYIFAWGAAAAVGAAVGPLQAKVVPRLADARQWLSRHRDLGPRFLVEGTSNSASSQLSSYGISGLLGLAALGYVQAANTLMGPFMVVFFGVGLVALPDAVRVLRRSPRQLVVFCTLIAGGLAFLAAAWGAVLLVALPMGLGHLVLGPLWRPTYPLVLPLTISVVGGCVMAGAGTGLHALAAAWRSMRAMVISSVILIASMLIGAAVDGAFGAVGGAAIAAWVGGLLFWGELRAELRSAGDEAHGIRWFVEHFKRDEQPGVADTYVDGL